MAKTIKAITVILVLVIGVSVYILIRQNSTPSTKDSLTVDTSETAIADEDILQNEDPAFIEIITEAERLYDAGFIDTALRRYLTANKLNKSSLIPFLGIAKIYLDNEKIDLAEQNLFIAQQKGKLPVNGRILLARLALLKKDYESAREILQSIRNENNEVIYLETILALLVNDFEKAKENIGILINNPENDRFKRAGEQLKAAFDVFSTFVDSPTSYLLTLSAENLIEINEFALARPLLFQAIDEKNDYRDAWVLLGYSYLQANKLEDSEQALKKAKQIDPYFGPTYFYLGVTKLALGRNREAQDYLTQAESFGYNDQQSVFLNLGNIYYSDRDYETAIGYYEQALDLGPIPLESYAKPIYLYLEPLDSPIKGLELAREALQQFPDKAMSFNLIGWAQLENKIYDEAQKNLENAISINPQLEAAHLNLGRLHTETDNEEVAIAYFEKAIQYARANGVESIENRALIELNSLNSSSDTTQQ